MFKHFFIYRIFAWLTSAVLFQFLLISHSFAQSVPFFHINSNTGLSSNNTTCLATDKNGLVWIGTNEGLQMYNGYIVEPFGAKQSISLGAVAIKDLYCDAANRIWVATESNLYLLDSNRHISMPAMPLSNRAFIIKIFSKQNNDIIVQATDGFYLYKKNTDPLQKKSWEEIKLLKPLSSWICNKEKLRDISHIDADKYLFIVVDTIFLVDMENAKLLLQMVIKGAVSGCGINNENMLVGNHIGELSEINIAKQVIVKNYEFNDKRKFAPALTDIWKIRKINPGLIMMTTFFGGLYFYNPQTGTLTRSLHEPLNEYSLSEDKTNEIYPDNAGNIFISTFNTGLNYCNLSNYKAVHINTFINEKGNIFDGYINDIVEDRQKNYWLAAYDRLIKWNRQNNRKQFIPYLKHFTSNGSAALEIKSLCVDYTGKIWASIYAVGVAVADANTGTFKTIFEKKENAPSTSGLGSAYIHDLYCDKNGTIWACSGTGIFTINSRTLALDTIHPCIVMNVIAGKRVLKIWNDDAGGLWFASQSYGAYCYRAKENKVLHYSADDGLPSNNCICFTKDNAGNIYIGTSSGPAILKKDGSIKVLGENDGWQKGACSGLLTDSAGNVWMLNKKKYLVCYNPATNIFRYFSDESGLNGSGYQTNSFYQTADGDMYWGNNRGISFFNPKQLLSAKEGFVLSVHKMLLPDTAYLFSTSSSLSLNYRQNNPEFNFAAVNFSGSKNIYYQYKLEGFDKDWIKATDVTTARYHALPAGHYTFLVKASRDGKQWTESENKIALDIVPPFWKTGWFRVLMIVCFLALAIIIYRYRIKTQRTIEEEKLKVAKLNAEKYKARLEMEKVINYFSSSLVDKHSVDEVLWDVAKNLIGRLGFEDCMIYLWNEDKTKMIQKAGYGPKGSLEKINKQHFDVAAGQGVVGFVMKYKEPVIINDTSVDERYRADEMVRLSEITVPIIYNDELIGIIDSEHHEKNFFTEKHLQLLLTIAALMETKIHDIQAQYSLQMAQKEKAEMQYENLKQHLNPHFLFNSLAAVIGLIKNDPKLAVEFIKNLNRVYRYILQNKDEQSVTLQAELDFAQQYFQLQKIRFGKGIEIHMHIDKKTLRKKIVPVTLQNLIENAIKHNIIDDENPLLIEIFTEGDYLMVRNNLQKKSFVETSNQLGLRNMKMLYNYLSDKPFLVDTSTRYFTVKIPLL